MSFPSYPSSPREVSDAPSSPLVPRRELTYAERELVARFAEAVAQWRVTSFPKKRTAELVADVAGTSPATVKRRLSELQRSGAVTDVKERPGAPRIIDDATWSLVLEVRHDLLVKRFHPSAARIIEGLDEEYSDVIDVHV